MRKNSLALGEKSFEGEYNRIMAAGDVNILHSDIKKLYVAGDVNVINSKIKKLRCAGEFKADSCTLLNCNIAGEANLKGICKADIFIMKGNLSADLLECNILNNCSKNMQRKSIKGNIKWKGGFKAETFENFFPITFSCNSDFKNIISSDLFICNEEIMCENFYSFAGLNAASINAENVTIISFNNVSVERLKGSNINVLNKFKPDVSFNSIPKFENYNNIVSESNIVNIKSIEGDEINIQSTNCDVVSGTDVYIGDLCIIEKVEYKNHIEISDKAIVNEVVKL